MKFALIFSLVIVTVAAAPDGMGMPAPVAMTMDKVEGKMEEASGDHMTAYKKEYEAMSCHPGYKAMAPGMIKAMEKCHAMKISSCACYKTCVQRERGNLHGDHNKTAGIDHGMVDVNMMEYFHMDKPEGRESYYRIASSDHKCGEIFAQHKMKKFAVKYDDAEECRHGTNYFDCVTDSFEC